MKHKNKVKKLQSRIRDWENTVNKSPDNKKAYKKPGSVKK